MLYKGLKGKVRIPTDDLIQNNRCCRNQHSLAFDITSASKEADKISFFPQTIRDWNDLPDSLISSAEMSDDCVSGRVRFVASGSGSELILFDLRLLKPEETSSVKSNRGLLVLEALLPLPNSEWKTEDGRGHVTAFLPTTMAASAAGPTFNDFH